MTRVILAVLALGLAAFLAVLIARSLRSDSPAPSASTPSPAPACGPVILFGDSLAAGFGAPSGEGLAESLASAVGIGIENAGRNGETSSSGLARIGSVASRGPSLVVIVLGGNDYLRGLSASLMRDNLAQAVRALQGSGSSVLLLGLQEPGGGAYAAAYRDVARETGIVLVPDAFGEVFGTPDLMADPIHPNRAGYAVVAERVAPVIRNALGSRPCARP